MFSIFPSDWQAPKPKWVSNQNSPNISPKNVHPKSVNNVPLNAYTPNNFSNIIPAEEMLKVGEEVDVTEIDRMLVELGIMADADQQGTMEIDGEQVLNMIKNINNQLEKSINSLRNNPYNENISNEDLLKLLQTFLDFAKNIENYFKMKEMNKI